MNRKLKLQLVFALGGVAVLGVVGMAVFSKINADYFDPAMTGIDNIDPAMGEGEASTEAMMSNDEFGATDTMLDPMGDLTGNEPTSISTSPSTETDIVLETQNTPCDDLDSFLSNKKVIGSLELSPEEENAILKKMLLGATTSGYVVAKRQALSENLQLENYEQWKAGSRYRFIVAFFMGIESYINAFNNASLPVSTSGVLVESFRSQLTSKIYNFKRSQLLSGITERYAKALTDQCSGTDQSEKQLYYVKSIDNPNDPNLSSHKISVSDAIMSYHSNMSPISESEKFSDSRNVPKILKMNNIEFYFTKQVGDKSNPDYSISVEWQRDENPRDGSSDSEDRFINLKGGTGYLVKLKKPFLGMTYLQKTEKLLDLWYQANSEKNTKALLGGNSGVLASGDFSLAVPF